MREVVVVPLGTPDAAAAGDAAPRVEAALEDAHVTVISSHDARDRFTARSRPPQQLTESDLETLHRASREATEHVAFGRTASANKSVREVITRAERALESLNRDTATARQVLDACLSLVRSTLQRGNREQAIEQGMRCRQLVPDLMPSRSSHPAQVIGVVMEVDDLLARMRVGQLSVQSTPSSRCAVYLNGRHVGHTPLELDRAAPGVYRVQVECGNSPARVHILELGDAPVSLVVDTVLDRAVETEPRLALRYDDHLQASRHAVSAAVSLGRAVAVDDVVLVRVESGSAELTRVRVQDQRLIGRTTLPWSEHRQAQALEQAVVALIQARVLGEPSLQNGEAAASLATVEPRFEAPPATEAMEEAPTAPLDEAPGTSSDQGVRPVHSPRARRLAIGLTSLAVGAGLFAAAGVATVKRDEAGDALRSLVASSGDAYEAYTGALSSWSDTRLEPYVFGTLGSLTLSVTALGLLLRADRDALPPWVSVASASAGLALAAWGTATLARGGACQASELDRRPCSDDLERRDHGALLLLAATPLLTVSLTQLLRRARGPETIHTQLSPVLDPLGRRFSLQAHVRWF